MTTPQFDIDTHIREAVDFEKGRVDYLPFEVKTPLIRAGWYAQEISKFFAGHDFNAMFPIGAKADQFVKRDGVFARHCIGNLTPDAPPTIRPAKHEAKPLGYRRLRPFAVFRNARLHPFLDQPQHSVVSDPMADELQQPLVTDVVEGNHRRVLTSGTTRSV